MHARKVNPSWCVTLPDQKQLPLSREMHFDSYFFLFVHREQQGMADDIYVEGVFPSYRRDLQCLSVSCLRSSHYRLSVSTATIPLPYLFILFGRVWETHKHTKIITEQIKDLFGKKT